MKKIFELRILLILIFLISHHDDLFSQQKILDGYIITNKGDSIFGKIKYGDEEKNIDRVLFLEAGKSNFTSYRPNDIYGYGVSGQSTFLSKRIEVDSSSMELNRLSYDVKPNMVSRQVFLNIIIVGPFSLYKYYFVGRNHYFISMNDNLPVELIYRKFLSYNENGTEIENKQEKFKNQLSLLLNNCDGINERIRQTSYSLKSLRKLMLYYYSCKGVPMNSIDSNHEIVTRFGVKAGLSFYNLHFEGYNYINLINSKFESIVNIYPGVSCILILPNNFKRHSINMNACLQHLNASGKSRFEENGIIGPEISNYQYSLKLTEIKFDLFYRFQFTDTKSLNAFLFVGPSFSVITSHNFSYTSSTAFGNIATQTFAGELFENAVRSNQEYINAGIGLQYKNHFGINFSFSKSNGFVEYARLSVKMKVLSVDINYLF